MKTEIFTVMGCLQSMTLMIKGSNLKLSFPLVHAGMKRNKAEQWLVSIACMFVTSSHSQTSHGHHQGDKTVQWSTNIVLKQRQTSRNRFLNIHHSLCLVFSFVNMKVCNNFVHKFLTSANNK